MSKKYLNILQLRHAGYYCQQLDKMNRLYRQGAPINQTLERFNVDREQLIKGYEWALASKQKNTDALELVLQYPIVGGDVLMQRLDMATLISWNETGLQLAQIIQNPMRLAGFHMNLGMLYIQRTELDKAEKHFQQASEIASEEELRPLTLNPYSGLANVAMSKGDFRLAENLFRKAIETWEQREAYREIAGDQGNLGIVYLYLEDFHKAHELLQQAVVTLFHYNDLWRVSAHLNNLGTVYSHLDKPRLAVQCYNLVLRLCRKIENWSEAGKNFAQIARLQMDLRHLERAERNIHNALRLAQEVDDRYAYHMRLATLARIKVEQERYTEALELYETSLVYIRKTGKSFDEATILQQQAYVYHSIGNLEKALFLFKEARNIAQHLGLSKHVKILDKNIQVVEADLEQSKQDT